MTRLFVGRDAQRTKVYRWERTHLWPHDQGRLTQPEIEQLVAEACALFGVTTPSVHCVTRHSGRATYCLSAIRLPKWACRTAVVLHEVAHHIAAMIQRDLGGDPEPAHGPTFVRVLYELACRFFEVSPATLRKTLTEARLKVAPAGVATTLTRSERKQLRDVFAAQQALTVRRAEVRRIVDALAEEERRLQTLRDTVIARVKKARRVAVERAVQTRAAKAERARVRWRAQRQQQQEAATTHVSQAIQGGQE